MDNKKLKLYIIIGVVATLLIVLVGVYLLRPSSDEIYPATVQEAITHPVDQNENWGTLLTNDEYEISYSKSGTTDSFFITVNAQPALDTSLKAEQAFLQKLGITQEYACALPVVIKIPFAVDQNLAGFEFGPSFCPNVVHVADGIAQSAAESETNITTNTNAR